MKLRKFLLSNSIIVAIIAFFLFFGGLYLFQHRMPITQNAFVVANIRPVSAYVPGHITNIPVINNTKVKKGDILFTVYREPYRLKMESLKYSEIALNYKLKALSHKIKSCQAAVNKYEVFNYTRSVDELLNLLTDVLDDTKELVQLCNYYPDVTNI